MRSDILVIIPAYNERRSIRVVVTTIRELHPGFDIAVIDDGSRDTTATEARDAGAKVISLPFNMGYGVALQTGYKYAIRAGYRYVVQIDADGQHDPASIDAILAPVRDGTADLVLGSRFHSASDYMPSFARRIGIAIFRTILLILSGKRFSDITTGFQAFNDRILAVFVSELFPCDYPDADVIMLLVRLGYEIVEVPVTMHPNVEGKSMHSGVMAVFYYVFKMLLSMTLTILRRYPDSFRHSSKGGMATP